MEPVSRLKADESRLLMRRARQQHSVAAGILLAVIGGILAGPGSNHVNRREKET
jgi:hypothetical protein